MAKQPSILGDATPITERGLRSAFFASHPEIFALLSTDGQIVDCNESFAQFCGAPPETLRDQSFDALLTPFGLAPWDSLCPRVLTEGTHRSKDWYQRRSDGVVKLIQFDLTALGAEHGFALTGIDLSDEASQQDKLERLAIQDTLTGVKNRRFVEAKIQELMSRPPHGGESFALLLLDLDGFKTVNDSFGHGVGDQVLRHVAETLCDAVPLGEIVGRIGGDEFVIIIEDYLGRPALHALAAEIRQAVARPIASVAPPLRISVSVGQSVFPEDGRDFTTLMARADQGMFRVKKSSALPAGLHEDARPFVTQTDDSALLRDLRRGLSTGQLAPRFQPIADLRSGRIVAAEALCRWAHPTRGPLEPQAFIPIAEHHGLIDQIDQVMLRAVIALIARHGGGALAGMRIFANVSAATVGKAEFAQVVLDLLEAHDVPPHALGLELTESMALLDSENGRECLGQLSAQGVSIALDDFGTGFSSLSLLKDLPVSYLKLDRSFVRNIDHDPRDSALVAAVMTLCDALGAKIIVEGIETESQRQKLLPLGPMLGQGFLLGRPTDGAQFIQTLNGQADGSAVVLDNSVS